MVVKITNKGIKFHFAVIYNTLSAFAVLCTVNCICVYKILTREFAFCLKFIRAHISKCLTKLFASTVFAVHTRIYFQE